MGSSDAAARRARGQSRLERVSRELGLAIMRGDHAPGSTLPVEADLCAAFGVSRNILREAIKTLAAKGMVRTARRAGTLVLPKTGWALLDPEMLAWAMTLPSERVRLLRELTRLRLIIEPEVAALAARQATAEAIDRLAEAYRDMARNVNHPVKAIESDIHFHRVLFESVDNQILLGLLQPFAALLRANFEITIGARGAFIRNLEEHRLIAEAVRRRDAEAARGAMRALLANNEEDLAVMLREGENGRPPALADAGGRR
jgi:DNA-binding FadR family transcriptional regulator